MAGHASKLPGRCEDSAQMMSRVSEMKERWNVAGDKEAPFGGYSERFVTDNNALCGDFGLFWARIHEAESCSKSYIMYYENGLRVQAGQC